MIMKALPTQYKAFTAVINQKEDDLTFPDFKILLRNYEDQEKIHSGWNPPHLQSCQSCQLTHTNQNIPTGAHIAK